MGEDAHGGCGCGSRLPRAAQVPEGALAEVTRERGSIRASSESAEHPSRSSDGQGAVRRCRRRCRACWGARGASRELCRAGRAANPGRCHRRCCRHCQYLLAPVHKKAAAQWQRRPRCCRRWCRWMSASQHLRCRRCCRFRRRGRWREVGGVNAGRATLLPYTRARRSLRYLRWGHGCHASARWCPPHVGSEHLEACRWWCRIRCGGGHDGRGFSTVTTEHALRSLSADGSS